MVKEENYENVHMHTCVCHPSPIWVLEVQIGSKEKDLEYLARGHMVPIVFKSPDPLSI